MSEIMTRAVVDDVQLKEILDKLLNVLDGVEIPMAMSAVASLICTLLANISDSHEDAKENYGYLGTLLAEGLCEVMNHKVGSPADLNLN